jgi:pilus assembly protein CpaB
MRSTRAFVMIGIAFLIAAAAVVLASQWVGRQAAMATKQVAVAAVDIEIGSRLTGQMMRAAPWPSGSIPEGAAEDTVALVDRVAKTAILKGEPILEGKLAPVGTTGGLSAIVAEGKRAMTVRVNDVVGVAGFALPGNYVDIMVNTFEEGAGSSTNKDKSVSKIVLEHILVLAVAQESSRDETKPKVVSAVTLEVSPEQAELLDLARSVGTLSLVLRNQVDPQAVATLGATKDKLLGQRTAPPAPAPAVRPATPRPAPKRVASAAPPQTCISVVTGTQVSRECF